MGKFAELLKSERKRAGKKLYETSEAVGLSVSYISDMEHGRKLPPDIEIVGRFENFFGTEEKLLIEVAEKERRVMPTNFMTKYQSSPTMQKVFFRLDDMNEEALADWFKDNFSEE